MSAWSNNRVRSRSFMGIILMTLGVIFLLGNFNVIYVGSFWHYWPVLIMMVGAVKILWPRHPEERGSGIFLFVLGSWFFVSTFHLFGLSFHNSWPLLLVGVGLKMIWNSAHADDRHCAGAGS